MFGAVSLIDAAQISLLNKNPENLMAFGAYMQEQRPFSDV
jgi:hypothetical protein